MTSMILRRGGSVAAGSFALLAAAAPAHAWQPANTCYGRADAFDIANGERLLPRVLRCSVPAGSDADQAYLAALGQAQLAVGTSLVNQGEPMTSGACEIETGGHSSEFALVLPEEIDGNRGWTTYTGDSCILPGDFQRIKAAQMMVANNQYFGEIAFWSALQENGFGFDNNSPSNAYRNGNEHARATIIHEIGHALGLAIVNTFSMESGRDLPISGGTAGHEQFFPDDMAGLVSIYKLYAFAAMWNNFFVSAQTFEDGRVKMQIDPMGYKKVCPGDAVTAHFTFGNTGPYGNYGNVPAEVFITSAWPGYAGGTTVGTWTAHMGPYATGTAAFDFTVPDVAPGSYHIFFRLDPGHTLDNRVGTDDVTYSGEVLDVQAAQACSSIQWPSLGPWVQSDNDWAPASASLAVVNNSNRGGALEAFVIGGDHNIFHKWQGASSVWNDYQPITPAGWLKKIAALDSPNGVFLFGIGGDDNLWIDEPSDKVGGYAYGWQKAGDQPIDEIVAANNQDGFPEVFGRTTDGRIMRMYQPSYNGNGGPTSPGRKPWSSWGPVSDSSLLFTDIAAASGPDYALNLFAVGADGTVWSARETGSQLSWGRYFALSDWGSIGHGGNGHPTQVVVASTPLADGRHLAVFTVDDLGAVQVNIFHEAIRGRTIMFPAYWTGWTTLALTGIRRIAVASNGEDGAGMGRLEVFGDGADRNVTHVWQTSTKSETSWGGPSSRLGNVRALVAAHNADGRIEIFGVSPDHRVMHDWEDFTRWNYWQY